MSPAKAHAVALPAFHALTGCDNTSFFSGTGKKSAYSELKARSHKHIVPPDEQAPHTLFRGY